MRLGLSALAATGCMLLVGAAVRFPLAGDGQAAANRGATKVVVPEERHLLQVPPRSLRAARRSAANRQTEAPERRLTKPVSPAEGHPRPAPPEPGPTTPPPSSPSTPQPAPGPQPVAQPGLPDPELPLLGQLPSPVVPAVPSLPVAPALPALPG